jgi:hypothetical protein
MAQLLSVPPVAAVHHVRMSLVPLCTSDTQRPEATTWLAPHVDEPVLESGLDETDDGKTSPLIKVRYNIVGEYIAF